MFIFFECFFFNLEIVGDAILFKCLTLRHNIDDEKVFDLVRVAFKMHPNDSESFILSLWAMEPNVTECNCISWN